MVGDDRIRQYVRAALSTREEGDQRASTEYWASWALLAADVLDPLCDQDEQALYPYLAEGVP